MGAPGHELLQYGSSHCGGIVSIWARQRPRPGWAKRDRHRVFQLEWRGQSIQPEPGLHRISIHLRKRRRSRARHACSYAHHRDHNGPLCLELHWRSALPDGRHNSDHFSSEQYHSKRKLCRSEPNRRHPLLWDRTRIMELHWEWSPLHVGSAGFVSAGHECMEFRRKTEHWNHGRIPELRLSGTLSRFEPSCFGPSRLSGNVPEGRFIFQINGNVSGWPGLRN